MPRAQRFIENDNSEQTSSNETLNILTNFDIVKMPNGQARPMMRPKKSYVGNKAVARLIMEKASMNNNAVFRLDNLIKASEDLLQLLDHELEIEDVLEDIPENNWND